MIQSIERGCGAYEAQKFADSLRQGADVGNESVHIIQGLVRAFNKALNIKDSEMSAQIRSAVTAAVSQPRPVPAVSGPTPQERATRRKMLNERLPALVKGTSIVHWIEVVRLIIRQDGTGLTPSEILDAVKKAACANNEVALNIDSNVAGKILTDVNELFVILTKLFKPDQHGYLAALRSKVQRENQPAADFLNEIKDLGYKHWIGLPDKEEGDQNDKKNFQDNRSSQYRGRGRGNGRGYANYNQPFEEKSPFSFMLQLNMDEEDSDLDVNICDLTPDDQTDTDREDQVSARDPDFMPVKIENRKPAIYVPSQAPVRKRKRTVTASTPQQAEKTVSDVLPCPPTPVGEQFPKLDLSCLSNLRTNKSAPKSPPVRKVIRKSRAASKTGPASKTPAGLPPLIARGRKPRHTKQVQAMIKEGMELLAGAYEFIDTAAASKSIDKGKRPMTPAECAAFESSQKSSGKPQLPQLPVPMEMQEVTFLPRVEPPPHATAFRNVPLYTDDCWKLPLPDSTRVAERQKDLCWPMKAALFDPTLHCFEKPPYWPAHLPKPAQHTDDPN
eukprot:jgi/Botrbrau1/19703/Bobra.0003s0064.1